MTDKLNPSIGNKINDFYVLGTERDGENRWVGADIYVNVQNVGAYFLRVITKGQYVSEQLHTSLDDIKHLNPQQFAEQAVVTRPPFVLNDLEIDQELLERKFSDRTVESDLAASLWPVETE